jgi:hypothetical protein
MSFDHAYRFLARVRVRRIAAESSPGNGSHQVKIAAATNNSEFWDISVDTKLLERLDSI